MKLVKSLQFGWMAGSLALACVFLSTAPTTRANVYATDIQIGGVLTNGAVPVPQGGTVNISYILNEAATGGVTINILSGTSVVDTISIASPNVGTLRGLNSVVWGTTNTAGSPVPAGNYSVSITAVGAIYNVWTQTSVDLSPGTPAHYPLGIAVDNNTNSPYYGRVVVGCALNSGTVNVPLGAMKVGLFKNNADGSQADEGWYGNANYLADDYGNPPVAGQMPAATGTSGYDPRGIRIGEDDRIYWADSTKVASVLSCDMLATQYQVVIAGPKGNLASSPYNYLQNSDISEYANGFHTFDVAFLAMTNPNPNLAPSLWLCDGDYPNPGIWMYHLTNNGVSAVNTVNNVLASDPNDTEGTQAVTTGGDIAVTANGGIMVDTNLDLFCGQSRLNENAFYDAMVFSNWNGGILPPEAGGFNYSTGTATGQVAWGYGCGVDVTCSTDPAFEAVQDVVINSRTSPTVVACPLGIGSQTTSGGGIRLLNAQTGAIITATNGSTVTTYTNLDWKQAYIGAAFDNVGNLYACSITRDLWRVWSPPNTNANTNTTVAVETVAVQSLPPTASLPLPLFSGTIGGSAQPLTATFNGAGPFTAQWYQLDTHNNVTAVPAGEVSSTAYSSTLTLTGLSAAQNGDRYYVVGTDANSLKATSSSATLKLYANTPPALLSFASTLGVNATNGWTVNGKARFTSPGVLRLTDGNGSEAASAFFAQPLDVSGFVATFTYTDVARGGADGVTFCLAGGTNTPASLGAAGGGLGVTGLAPTAELELNLYTGAGGPGITYATGGSISKPGSNAPVSLVSGNPINVTIIYTNSTLWVNLYDTAAGTTYSTNYTGGATNNITNVLGATTAYVGFTGGDGGVSSYQTVSNFLFQSITNQVVMAGSLTNGTLPLSWTPASFTLLESASLQGPWTAVPGTVTTNFATGQATITPAVTPAGPTEYFTIIAP